MASIFPSNAQIYNTTFLLLTMQFCQYFFGFCWRLTSLTFSSQHCTMYGKCPLKFHCNHRFLKYCHLNPDQTLLHMLLHDIQYLMLENFKANRPYLKLWLNWANRDRFWWRWWLLNIIINKEFQGTTFTATFSFKFHQQLLLKIKTVSPHICKTFSLFVCKHLHHPWLNWAAQQQLLQDHVCNKIVDYFFLGQLQHSGQI